MKKNIAYSYIDIDWLVCPGCGGENLHHGKVTVFKRREDEETVKVITVLDDGIEQKGMLSHLSGNPSSRRDGLRIAFWCENCDANPELVVSQHKGNTSLYWEVAP